MLKRLALVALVLFALLALFVTGLWLDTYTATGSSARGERLARMKRSPQWNTDAGKFTNRLPRTQGTVGDMLSKYNAENPPPREPSAPVKPLQRRAEEFRELPASGLRVTWLGHSTLLVEIDGARVLVDPVWSEYASPFTWIGPKRFYAPPLALEDLPPIDAIIISHDHYDHLDHMTVMRLRTLQKNARWLVPLGVGAHLEFWGIPKTRIDELDWWQEVKVKQSTITCAPSRHFSGRSILFTDQNATLWAGWALRGPQHRVFYSGDTAMHDEFAKIGEKLGPFDLTIMEAGAYDALWPDVHIGPEQAVLAHKLLRGKVMLPVHWGTFNLANHGWTEPIERVLAAAKNLNVPVAAPRPGGSIEPTQDVPTARWWPDTRWHTAAQSPLWSTSVDPLIHDYRAKYVSPKP